LGFAFHLPAGLYSSYSFFFLLVGFSVTPQTVSLRFHGFAISSLLDFLKMISFFDA